MRCPFKYVFGPDEAELVARVLSQTETASDPTHGAMVYLCVMVPSSVSQKSQGRLAGYTLIELLAKLRRFHHIASHAHVTVRPIHRHQVD
jgi:hypothetical protein